MMKKALIFRLMILMAVIAIAWGCADKSESNPADGDYESAGEVENDTESESEDDFEADFTWEEWPSPQVTDIPRPEHPDPAFARRDWLNLNGQWEFTFDPDDKGLEEDWAGTGKTFDGNINVPFCWSSILSGLNADTGDEGGIGWYRRSFTAPESFKDKRIMLVIGAADWDVSIFINAQQVVLHADSGYLPVKTDITDFLKEGSNEIVIRVQDFGNAAEYPHGKQGSPWYANVGGIWQTVYLEAAAATRFESIRLSPDNDSKTFTVKVQTGGVAADNCTISAYAKGQSSTLLLENDFSGPEFSGEIAVPWLDVWSPESPALQEFEWRLSCNGESDTVRTYAGLRQVTREKLPGQDFEAVHINGTPTYIRGVLVQGYNPDGHYTYPSEQAIIDDLTAAQKAGFNLVRLHIKVEEPLVLYHADRLGLLVDYDVPCYGAFPFKSGDGPQARAAWQSTMEGQFRRDFNHPSVIWWTLFNEDWGFLSLSEEFDSEKQAFVKSMLSRARELDATRLIEDHSTLRYDHVSGTDINSFHLYLEDAEAFRADILEWVTGCYPGSEHNFIPGEKQDGAPLLNTEYGPFSAENGAPEWKRNRDISWGFQVLTGIMRSQNMLVGYIFTELYDVEFELNGVLDYARVEKDFGYPFEGGVAGINSANFVGFKEAYFQVAQGTSSISLTPFTSSFAPISEEDAAAKDDLKLGLYNASDEMIVEITGQAEKQAWQAVDQEAVEISIPADLHGGAYVLAEWKRNGEVIATNFIPGEIITPAPPAADCQDGQCDVALDLAACFGVLDSNSVTLVDSETQSTGILGDGILSCAITIPSEIPADKSVSVWFEAEASQNRSGSPQTSTLVSENSEALLKLGNADLGAVSLPPERADSRGILSHLNGSIPRGAYGDLITSEAAGATLTPGAEMTLTIEMNAEENGSGGILIFGRRLGRYGQTPVLHFSWE